MQDTRVWIRKSCLLAVIKHYRWLTHILLDSIKVMVPQNIDVLHNIASKQILQSDTCQDKTRVKISDKKEYLHTQPILVTILLERRQWECISLCVPQHLHSSGREWRGRREGVRHVEDAHIVQDNAWDIQGLYLPEYVTVRLKFWLKGKIKHNSWINLSFSLL